MNLKFNFTKNISLLFIFYTTFSIINIKYPSKYYDLKKKKNIREKRPLIDTILAIILNFSHNTYLKYPVGYCKNYYYKKLVSADIPFKLLEQDSEKIIRNYCIKYGIKYNPDSSDWLWNKHPKDYVCFNEFFARKYKNKSFKCGINNIMTPSTSTIYYSPNVLSFKSLIKNEKFDIYSSGLNNPQDYIDFPCIYFYLSQEDYHCYHAPITGYIENIQYPDLTQYSTSVKLDLNNNINFLKYNRKCIITIKNDKITIVLIIIGGIFVDSIKLESNICIGKKVMAGDLLGCFKLGGSAILMLTNRKIKIFNKYKVIENRITKLDVLEEFCSY